MRPPRPAGASQEKEPPRPVLGSAERWHHINSQWMDMIPDTSQALLEWAGSRGGNPYFLPVLILPHTHRITEEPPFAAAASTEVPAENIAAQDKHEVERLHPAPSAFAQKQLLSLCAREFPLRAPLAPAAPAYEPSNGRPARAFWYDALGGDEFLTRYRCSSVEHHLKVIPMSGALGHDDPLLLYGYTTATREAQRILSRRHLRI